MGICINNSMSDITFNRVYLTRDSNTQNIYINLDTIGGLPAGASGMTLIASSISFSYHPSYTDTTYIVAQLVDLHFHDGTNVAGVKGIDVSNSNFTGIRGDFTGDPSWVYNSNTPSALDTVDLGTIDGLGSVGGDTELEDYRSFKDGTIVQARLEAIIYDANGDAIVDGNGDNYSWEASFGGNNWDDLDIDYNQATTWDDAVWSNSNRIYSASSGSEVVANSAMLDLGTTITGGGVGDPHITTFTGAKYDL